MKKTVLLTGATGGIGRGYSEETLVYLLHKKNGQ